MRWWLPPAATLARIARWRACLITLARISLPSLSSLADGSQAHGRGARSGQSVCARRADWRSSGDSRQIASRAKNVIDVQSKGK